MKKHNLTEIILTTLMCLLPILLALVLYDRLPARIPIHFDGAGNPDNYLPKPLAVFGLPSAFALLNLYLHARLNLDPKAENASAAMKAVSKWAMPVISVVFLPISMFIAMGETLPVSTVAGLLAGVVVVLAGNYLPKSRQNYTVGIRLPWTLHSEENWNKTHRFAGCVWVLGGLLLILNAFMKLPWLLLVVLPLLVLLPLFYSWLSFEAKKRQKT